MLYRFTADAAALLTVIPRPFLAVKKCFQEIRDPCRCHMYIGRPWGAINIPNVRNINNEVLRLWLVEDETSEVVVTFCCLDVAQILISSMVLLRPRLSFAARQRRRTDYHLKQLSFIIAAYHNVNHRRLAWLGPTYHLALIAIYLIAMVPYPAQL